MNPLRVMIPTPQPTMNSHQPKTMPSTTTASVSAHHSGHQEYGGKKPSSPAPSMISASLRSSRPGALPRAGAPREEGTRKARKNGITRAGGPGGAAAISHENGAATP